MAKSILLTAMAGAMGWGIRGQYGHETGAMIAGVLVSLVLVLLHCPQTASLPAARAVAFGTIAMGIGGSMTYGQTIGLTQNPEVIGNWEAWRWGMLSLGIKGAIWIGFAISRSDGTRITRIHWRGMATLSRVDARRCSRGAAHRRRIHIHGLGERALRSRSCHRLHTADRGSSRSVVALPRRPANHARADRWQDRSNPRLRRSSDRAN